LALEHRPILQVLKGEKVEYSFSATGTEGPGQECDSCIDLHFAPDLDRGAEPLNHRGSYSISICYFAEFSPA